MRRRRLLLKPGVHQDLFQTGPVYWAVLEQTTYQVLALARNVLVTRGADGKTDSRTNDLLVLFERNVAAHHVVEEDTQGPRRGGHAVVLSMVDPFGW